MQAASLEVLEKAQVPPAQARAIVRAIEIEISGYKDTLATKHDTLLLRHEMGELRTELKGDMAHLRAEFKADMAQLRGEVRADMAQLRGEVRADIGDLRGELRAAVAGMVTHGQLYAAISAQTALLLGIAYFFVTHLQH